MLNINSCFSQLKSATGSPFDIQGILYGHRIRQEEKNVFRSDAGRASNRSSAI